MIWILDLSLNLILRAPASITLIASFFPFSSPPSGELLQASNGKFSGTTAQGGDIGVGTIYEFDPMPGAPVPGPLPLMGAAAPFGWSRRLRRRMQHVRPVFPIGR